MSSTLDFPLKKLDVNVSEYIRQHEVVYLTPGYEGYEGFPLGNGDLGVMAWTPADCLKFQVNKCNTWDDAPDGAFGAWDDGNMANLYTSLSHCCQISVQPGFPVFERCYLQDFSAKLSLADGQAAWYSKTPFGQVKCSMFVARQPQTIILQYEDDLSEPVTRKINLMRYGTRVFEHWYADLKRDAFLGNGRTHIEADGDTILISHKTRSLEFAVAAKIISTQATCRKYNQFHAGFEINTGKNCSFALAISVATSEEVNDPKQYALLQVVQACNTGIKNVFTDHQKWWHNFWSASFIDIPNKYLENLWYINMYQLASSSAGDYPPHFINSLWSWNRDCRAWNHYYHWNQQCYTWPLFAAGHPELIESYAKFRIKGLPHAIEDAKKVHSCTGAFYSDVCNRKGFQDIIEPGNYKPTCDTEYLKTYVVPSNTNLTPGAQIAHDLYRHYEYTRDTQFLRKYTFPILKGWIEFICGFIEKGQDGKYHVKSSSPYEAVTIRTDDATSALAYVKLLFPIFIDLPQEQGANPDFVSQVQEIYANLADYPKATLSSSETNCGKPDTVIVAGGSQSETGEPLHKDSPSMKGQYTNFLICSQLTPVFPAGLVGVERKNTAEFKQFYNTLKSNLPMEVNGHTPTLNWIVRLGLSDIIEDQLMKWTRHHQLYPQGFWGYWARRFSPSLYEGEYVPNGFAADFLNVGASNNVKVLGSNEYVKTPKHEFAHIGLEAGCIFQSAVNDMLLAGHSDVITVFPCTPAHWQCRFKLHAAGGFIITSEKIDGTIAYIAIESKFGHSCRLTNPWPGEMLRITDLTENSGVLVCYEKHIACFETRPRHKYLVENSNRPVTRLDRDDTAPIPVAGPRELYDAVIGKPRQY